MKILQVCQTYHPCFASGGVVRVVYEISGRLVSMGHEVTVYTTDDCDKITADNKHPQNVEGVNVYYFKNVSKKLKSKMKITNPYYIPLIARKEIKKFDIIHIHEHRTILAAVVCHYARKYGVPYIVQAHGSIMPLDQKILLKNIFDKLWGNKILKNAYKTIAVTEIEAKQYENMGIGKDKIEIVPNGLDLSEFKSIPKRGIFRKKYGIGKNDKVILYLGRIHKIKGLDLLIKSFAEISNGLESFKLVIVGPDDGFMNYLVKLIKELQLKDDVLFTGPLYNKDKLEAYVDSDVLIYPAKHEIFGLVPFEAIMCGTPVIVSKETGCGELIKKGKCGCLVKYGDLFDLKEKIKFLIENKDVGDKKIDNGKKYIKETLDWEKLTNRVAKIYERCIYNF